MTEEDKRPKHARKLESKPLVSERDRSLESFRPTSEEDFSALGLAYRAAPLAEAFKGRLPTKPELQNVTEELGVELATALYVKTLQQASGHGEFQRRLRALEAADLHNRQTHRKSIEILFVPSSFQQSGRRWGGHVEIWRKWARDLGFQTDVVETDPRASIAANARIISQHLLANPHPRRFLVSYSQGTSEFRYLLERRQGKEVLGHQNVSSAEFEGLAAWINVCGAYFGASGSKLTRSSSWRRLLSHLQMRLSGRNPKILMETSPEFLLWKKSPVSLKSMMTASLIGCPLRTDLPINLKESYDFIAKTAPNDGMVSVHEAASPPGFILPVSGMSHRAEEQKLKPILLRTLVLMADAVLASPRKEDAGKEDAGKEDERETLI